VSALRELLLGGEYRPGEHIAELPLVDRLGVSRTPIRLALEKLAQEGLLENSPTGGFTVRMFTLSDIWDAIEARGALEGAAAKLAAERVQDAAQLAPLRQFTAEMAALPDPSATSLVKYSRLNAAFHRALVDLARSPMLRWALERFQSIPFAATTALVLPVAQEIVDLAIAQHDSIVNFIERREGEAAARVARSHAQLSRQNLEIALGDKNLLSRVPGASLIRLTPSGFAEPNGKPALWSNPE
jgi:GntR family transcriptional regulator of vanillate catabolism